MYEYEVINNKTKERRLLFGHTFANACERAKVDPAEYDIEYSEYID